MPIDYEHGDPLFALLAGSQLGAAQLQRQQADRQQAADLQYAKLDEDARQADMANLLQQNMADLQNQRARQAVGLGLQRDRATAQAQQQNDWRDFQQQIANSQLNQQGQLDKLGYQAQLDMDAANNDFSVDAGKQANLNAKDTISQYRQMNLKPEGEALRAQWDAKIRSFQGKQGEYRPQVYAQGMSELLEGMAAAGIEDFETRDQTPDEIRGTRTVDLDDYNTLVIQPDGKISINKKQIPPQPKEEKPVDPGKVRKQTGLGEMTQDQFNAQSLVLRDKAIAAMEKRYTRIDDEGNETVSIPDGKDKKGNKKYRKINDNDILAEVRRIKAFQDALANGGEIPDEDEASGVNPIPMTPPPPISQMKNIPPRAASTYGVTGYFRWMGKTFFRDEDGNTFVQPSQG